jgi:acetyl esterase/lipase
MAAGIPDDETTSVWKMRHDMEQLGKAPLPLEAEVRSVRMGGVDCEWVSVPECRADGALLYLHGGGYVAGSPSTHRALISRVGQTDATACPCPCLPARPRASISSGID